jgi:hypothetical protein
MFDERLHRRGIGFTRIANEGDERSDDSDGKCEH